MRRTGTIARPNTSQPLDEGPAAPSALLSSPRTTSCQPNVRTNCYIPTRSSWKDHDVIELSELLTKI